MDKIKDHFASEFYVKRKKETHMEHIKDLNEDVNGHYSKTFGVNRKSLLDVKYFDMFQSGLPHDAMHDLLEGIAPYEVKLLLAYYISQNFFTLDEFNERLLNFNYGYSESDKPIPILRTSLNSDKKSLRSSSSQMLLLVRILPFLIGDKVSEDNDPHWYCFLLLRKIFDIVLCPVVSNNLCSSLKLLINEHHSQFIALYGCGSYIPKMHFLIHYPEQMKAIGPMVRAWTIRHEAKLNFFKQSSRLANFKNIALSLAN